MLPVHLFCSRASNATLDIPGDILRLIPLKRCQCRRNRFHHAITWETHQEKHAEACWRRIFQPDMALGTPVSFVVVQMFEPCLNHLKASYKYLRVHIGKRSHNYGKSPFLMGKSTINGHVQSFCCMFTRPGTHWFYPSISWPASALLQVESPHFRSQDHEGSDATVAPCWTWSQWQLIT